MSRHHAVVAALVVGTAVACRQSGEALPLAAHAPARVPAPALSETGATNARGAAGKAFPTDVTAATLPVIPVAVAASRATPALSSGAQPAAPPLLRVPRAPRRIVPSRNFDVAVWSGAVNTHTLADEAGRGAVPVSEARFLWRDDTLYVRFYAGDLDLQVHTQKPDGPTWRDDSLSLSFFLPDGAERRITISATGVVADGICPDDATSLGDSRCDLRWQSHARALADVDGTINQLGDFDEEWNLEIAIPLLALGVHGSPEGSHLSFALSRCEVAYDGPRACGRWGSERRHAELVLE